MSNPTRLIDSWTSALINAECRSSYRKYEKLLIKHYSAYYERHSNLRCARHAYSARSLSAALPDGYAALRQLLPPRSTHIHARSARSSQSLALALLGCAADRDPSLRWFWKALRLPHQAKEATRYTFEQTLSPPDLNEQPRASQLDFVAETSHYLAAVECKWSEAGFGICSCTREREGNPGVGGFCPDRVIVRPKYWQTAQKVFGLFGERLPFLPCPISTAYQAIRTAAAARQLAGRHRRAVFVLLFDANNPYFRHTGAWPGWPALLRQTVATKNTCSRFRFRALSWQHLIRLLPLLPEVREWALEKHRLG